MFDELDEKIDLNKEKSDDNGKIDLLSPHSAKKKQSFFSSKKKRISKSTMPMHTIPKKDAKDDKKKVAPSPKKSSKPKKSFGEFFANLFKSKSKKTSAKDNKENKNIINLAHDLDSISASDLNKKVPDNINSKQEQQINLGAELKPNINQPVTKDKESADRHQEAKITAVPEGKPADVDDMSFHKIMEINHKNKGKKGDKKADLDMEVNLLPDKKKKLSPSQMIASYILVFSICAVAVAGPYLFYTVKDAQYRKENDNLNEQIVIINSGISEKQSQIESFGTLSYKLNHLESIFNSHIYWSNFFPLLEKTTSKGVFFNSLAVGNDYSISLGGEAIDLFSAAEQLVIYQNTSQYQSVELSGLSMPQEDEKGEKTNLKVSFTFTLDGDVVHEEDLAN